MLLLLAQGLLNKIVNININIVNMSERRENIFFYDFLRHGWHLLVKLSTENI